MLETTTVYASIFSAMRPNARASPSSATASASELAIRGIISIMNRPMKIFPAGSITFVSRLASQAASPANP